MKKKSIQTELTVFETFEELTPEHQNLMAKAELARESAYAPYSKFKVGAAVLLENGTVVIGSNQENASYPAGMCAERVAVFQAGARFPNVPMKAIAISVVAKEKQLTEPAAPCGFCRQSIIEYEQRQQAPIVVLMRAGDGEIYSCESMAAMLPLAFDNSFLPDS